MGKFLKFEKGTILVLSLFVVVIFVWIFFNLYHSNNRVDVPVKIVEFSEKRIPEKYDEEFVRSFYSQNKDLFYKDFNQNSRQDDTQGGTQDDTDDTDDTNGDIEIF